MRKNPHLRHLGLRASVSSMGYSKVPQLADLAIPYFAGTLIITLQTEQGSSMTYTFLSINNEFLKRYLLARYVGFPRISPGC